MKTVTRHEIHWSNLLLVVCVVPPARISANRVNVYITTGCFIDVMLLPPAEG